MQTRRRGNSTILDAEILNFMQSAEEAAEASLVLLHRADIPGRSMSAGLARIMPAALRVPALGLSLPVADVIPRFPAISRRPYRGP